MHTKSQPARPYRVATVLNPENIVVFKLNMYFIAIGWNFLSIVWDGLAPPFLFDELHRKTFSLPKTVKIVSLLLIRLSFVETPSLTREGSGLTVSHPQL